MKKYIINDLDDNTMNGGRKARNDVFHFAKEAGFEEVVLPFIIHPQDRSLKAKLKKLKYSKITIPHLIKNISDADVIVFQYPMYSTYLMNHLIADLKKYTRAKLIYVIHDIEGIRMFNDSQDYSNNEMNILKQADGIIAHNQAMQDWLKKHGITAQMTHLGIFDYLNPQPLNTNENYDKSVVFAGSLEKSTFLKKLNPTHPFILYGPHPTTNYGYNIEYKGKLSPEELPKNLTQSFGLVWDGDEIQSCAGPYGYYLKYNDPHKVSLYLSSGIPVIVWNQAALAQFITANKIGVTINDLKDLDSLLDSISPTEYHEIKENTLKIATKLRSGFYIKNALKKIVKQVMVDDDFY